MTSSSSLVRPSLKAGHFYHLGQPLAPVGFNYWPCRSGVDCWNDFDLDEWEEDFREMKRRGYNTVRFFLIWPDFQPEEYRIDEQKIERFCQVLKLGAKYDLWLMPTVFQGWMSGTNFDPVWRAGRPLIRDLTLRQAMIRLMERVCLCLTEAPNILALDFANEIDAICQDVDRAAIHSWTSDLRGVVERILPGLAMTNGCALTPMRSLFPWTYEDQAVDFHCMHGYPMFWTPLPTCTLRSARSSLIFGGMTSFAGAYGPVMRQEYGTAIGGDSPLIGAFLRASSYAAYLAGSNGFLFWCWKDFSSKKEPYLSEPKESSLGYVDARMQSKDLSPGLDHFMEFYKEHADWKPVPDPIGIYIPREFKGQGEWADEAMAFAWENLVANGCLPRFVSKIDETLQLLVLPITHLCIDEIDALDAFCLAGGKVIALGVASKTCGYSWEALTSTRQSDVFRSEASSIAIQSTDGAFDSLKIPLPGRRAMPWPIFTALSDEVSIWQDSAALPLGWISQRGKGKIVQFIAPLTGGESEDLDPDSVGLWKKMLSLVDWSGWDISCPKVQVGVIKDSSGQQKLLVINHSTESQEVRLQKGELNFSQAIAGKDIALLSLKIDVLGFSNLEEKFFY